jgi:hypothetical protein
MSKYHRLMPAGPRLRSDNGQSGSYFRGTVNEMGPEVGFEEIAIDLPEARFLDNFRLADNRLGTARSLTS